MSSHELAFVYAPETERLSYPADCPFKTRRTERTRERLLALGLLGSPDRREVVPARATREELEAFHAPEYLDELERAAGGELTLGGLAMGLGGPDTPVFPDLYEYGAWACGGALKAAELLRAGDAEVVFSLAGGFHHAHADRASGFCYLADGVLACGRLAAGGGRVAYVDVDAHHGDGVQEAFYDRGDVLTLSLHESGRTLFPGGGFEDEIGEGPGRGYNVNVPLPAGMYDEAYLEAFEAIVPPLLGRYDPAYVVVELGMDTLAGDPLTHFELTNNVHVEVLRSLRRLGRPLLVLGGGGYHEEHTVRGWALAWRTCCGDEDELESGPALGGVMLASSEWVGGLRDRSRPVRDEQRQAVEPELRRVLKALRKTHFEQAPPAVPGGPSRIQPTNQP